MNSDKIMDNPIDAQNTLEARYRKTKKIFMRKAIKSSHTATMKEAFVGVTRFRFAVEGAIRKNIESGLMAISKLELE